MSPCRRGGCTAGTVRRLGDAPVAGSLVVIELTRASLQVSERSMPGRDARRADRGRGLSTAYARQTPGPRSMRASIALCKGDSHRGCIQAVFGATQAKAEATAKDRVAPELASTDTHSGPTAPI